MSGLNNSPPAHGTAADVSNNIKSHQCHLPRCKHFVAFTSIYSHWLAEGVRLFLRRRLCNMILFFKSSRHCQNNKLWMKLCNTIKYKRGHVSFVLLTHERRLNRDRSRLFLRRNTLIAYLMSRACHGSSCSVKCPMIFLSKRLHAFIGYQLDSTSFL